MRKRACLKTVYIDMKSVIKYFFFGVVPKISDFFFSLLLFLSHLKLQESLAETERKLSVAQE